MTSRLHTDGDAYIHVVLSIIEHASSIAYLRGRVWLWPGRPAHPAAIMARDVKFVLKDSQHALNSRRYEVRTCWRRSSSYLRLLSRSSGSGDLEAGRGGGGGNASEWD